MKNSTPLRRQLLLLFPLFMFALSGFSQQKQNWIIAKNGKEIGFYEYAPVDYSANPTKKYPLIIFLHGYGERGDGRSQLANILLSGTPPRLIADGNPMTFTWNGKTETFIVISPQLNSEFSWWQNWYVDELLAYAQKTYRIDADRIFLTGLSMGGGGTWAYAGASLDNAKKFAAIGVSCGACTNFDRCNLANANLPVWAFHARDDNSAAPYSCTVGTIAAINACNPAVPPYFTTYETGNHWIWGRVYDPGHNEQDPNLYEWFLAQNRSLPVNKRPIVNAPDVTTTSSLALATLDASGSTDPDGKILRYAWRKISGPSGAVDKLTALFSLDGKINITGLTTEGTYVYEVRVIDDRADYSVKNITLTVVAGAPGTKKPVANAGADFTVFLPATSTQLNGKNSYDPDGTIVKWEWSQVKGPTTVTFTNNNSSTPTANNLVLGYYTFKLVVTDNNGITAEDQVDVTVSPTNILPVPKAGPDIYLTLPNNTATLDGKDSYDPDGTLKAFEWSYVSGPSQYTITDATAMTTTVTGLVEGTYAFKIRTWDNWYQSANDTVRIFVSKNPTPPANRAPVASAGPDREITLPANSASLDGSGSSDPDNNISKYEWTKVSGPASFNIVNGSSASTEVNGLTEGIYEFKLTVTDAGGLSSSDNVIVKVNPRPNQVPVVSAGPDQEITLPANSVSLVGSATDPDNNISSYSWTRISGPSSHTFSNAASASTNVNDLTEGTYEFKLTVTDAGGLSSSDNVIVKVNPRPNQAPVADAGPDRNITLPVTTTSLDGSGSKDADNNIKTYEWSWVSGPSTYHIDAPAAVSTGLSNLVEGTYVFRLTVTDEGGLSSSDQVTVIVNPEALPNNQPPVADAGTDIAVTLPEIASVSGSNSKDNDGNITTWLWEWVSGPSRYTITDRSKMNTTITNLEAGTYVFRLTVTDNGGLSSSDNITIVVNPNPNKPPVANAGPDITITLPVQTATLDGSGSTDPENKALRYTWRYISGPNSYSITSANSATTNVSGLVEGSYEFELLVTDDGGLISKDTVKVIVKQAPNQLPVAKAGADLVVVLPNPVISLNGSASVDNDGTITAWKWTRISGPNAPVISNDNTKIAGVTGVVVGVYQFELVVTDNRGGIGKDTVKVTVNPAPNKAPTANAGADITITLPVQSVTLDGSSSADPEGKQLSYAWSYVSGPTPYSIASPASAKTTVSGLAEGTYQFQLLVTDDGGLTSKDIVIVTVRPAPNKLPTANAGADFSVTLPAPQIQLNGSASSDPDGEILTWKWSRISGPGTITLNNAQTKIATVLGVAVGVHQFELVVTDNRGGIDKDTVKLTVNPTPNKAPIAIAGEDTTIAVPGNMAILNGTASFDPDGVITSAKWTQVSGPRSASLSTPNNVATNAMGLIAGSYEFELMVTDNKGAVGKDTITVAVVNNFKYREELALYPNPARGTLNIRCISDTEGDAVATIIDMKGQVLRTFSIPRTQSVVVQQIQVAGLNPGVYYLHVIIGNKKKMVSKFVKQ